MVLPTLSPEQRADALQKAAAARKARAEIKERLKKGEMQLAEVISIGETDEVVSRMRVSAVLESLPGIGKVRAEKLMRDLRISDSRRIRGLGDNQRRALLEELGSGRSGH
ncbi:MAG: integration host factor, actinobacterial type [Mycobacteriales bacterium]